MLQHLVGFSLSREYDIVSKLILFTQSFTVKYILIYEAINYCPITTKTHWWLDSDVQLTTGLSFEGNMQESGKNIWSCLCIRSMISVHQLLS